MFVLHKHISGSMALPTCTAKCIVENPVVVSDQLSFSRLIGSDYWGTELQSPEVREHERCLCILHWSAVTYLIV